MSYNLFHNLPELARNGGFALCDGGDEKENIIDWRFIGESENDKFSFFLMNNKLNYTLSF